MAAARRARMPANIELIDTYGKLRMRRLSLRLSIAAMLAYRLPVSLLKGDE